MAHSTTRFAPSTTLVIVAALLLAPPGQAQERLKIHGADPIGGPVTPYRVDVDLSDLHPVEQWQPGDPIKEIPHRFFGSDTPRPPLDQMRPDPLADLQRATELQIDSGFVDPIVNTDGIDFTGVNPPDAVGDVGPDHYIQAVNATQGSVFQVYDKDGAPLTGVLSMSSLGGGACSGGIADPIVLYDRHADRWFLQELNFANFSMCVYVSQTGDPVSGGWFHYEFHSPNLPDYPHFGVWPDAYYATTNEAFPAVYALDRINMLTGAPARPMQRFQLTKLPGYGVQAATPADLDGALQPPPGAPGLILRHIDEEAHSNFTNDPATDLLEIYAFTVDFDNAANSRLDQLPDLVITDFNSKFEDYTTLYVIPQPDTALKLDPIRTIVLHRLQYLNLGAHETIVGVLPTNLEDVTTTAVNAGLRWFELRRTGGDWFLFQEGTFAPGDADENRFVGSISMDASGNLALGYSITDIDPASPVFPSLRYTGRLSDDPAGVMTQIETQPATGTGVGPGRWGDYAAMTVDPVDDHRFWFTSQYQIETGWATRITSFAFDNPLIFADDFESGDTGAWSIVVPVSPNSP